VSIRLAPAAATALRCAALHAAMKSRRQRSKSVGWRLQLPSRPAAQRHRVATAKGWQPLPFDGKDLVQGDGDQKGRQQRRNQRPPQRPGQALGNDLDDGRLSRYEMPNSPCSTLALQRTG